MTKTLLDKTVASAIQGNDVSSMNRFGENCKTAKDWKKLEYRCYRNGWIYKLEVTGELPKAGCDLFSLYAAHTEKEAIEFAFGCAEFGHSCLGGDNIPDYVLPFKLYSYDKLADQSRFIYEYVPKTPMPDWEVYKLIIPNNPYKQYWYLYYSKNEQTAIKEAQHEARFCLLNDFGYDNTPEEYVPLPYYVLQHDKIIYKHVPPFSVNPDYLLVDPFSR
jgi:hypothetical protein